MNLTAILILIKSLNALTLAPSAVSYLMTQNLCVQAYKTAKFRLNSASGAKDEKGIEAITNAAKRVSFRVFFAYIAAFLATVALFAYSVILTY